MKKDQLSGLGFRVLKICIFAAVIFFVPRFTHKVNPHWIPYLISLCLVLAVIFASISFKLKKRQETKKDSLKHEPSNFMEGQK